MNPNAIVLILFTTVVGALMGNPLAGLAVGLGIVLFASMV
jgi:hypothetical protein